MCFRPCCIALYCFLPESAISWPLRARALFSPLIYDNRWLVRCTQTFCIHYQYTYFNMLNMCSQADKLVLASNDVRRAVRLCGHAYVFESTHYFAHLSYAQATQQRLRPTWCPSHVLPTCVPSYISTWASLPYLCILHCRGRFLYKSIWCLLSCRTYPSLVGRSVCRQPPGSYAYRHPASSKLPIHNKCLLLP